MAGYWTDVFSYVTGAVRNRNLACVANVADDRAKEKDDHTFFFQWDEGVWGRLTESSVEWTTVDSVVCSHPVTQVIFLGLTGEIFCAGSGDVHEEVIREGRQDSPENRGMMRGIGAIDGKAYAVGMQRQVYRRDEVNLWTCVDESARPDASDDNVYSFEAISGFSTEEIYAVGRRGEIWRYDGSIWVRQDSPTNMILTKVCCAGDGNAYACGRVGTLIRGRGERWELIEHGATKRDFWSVAWFKNHLYLSTMQEVFRLDDDTLSKMDFGKDIPSSCFALSAADGVLWSIGAKDVMAFDGTEWSRID